MLLVVFWLIGLPRVAALRQRPLLRPLKAAIGRAKAAGSPRESGETSGFAYPQTQLRRVCFEKGVSGFARDDHAAK